MQVSGNPTLGVKNSCCAPGCRPFLKILRPYFYAQQLYRQLLLRERISYGDSVCLSVCLGCHDPLPNQAQVRETPGFHRVVA